MGLFHLDDNSTHVCPIHDLSENATSPIFGSTSFYDFNKILSGSCAAFACLIVLVHMFSHALRLSNPSEQIKIMRVSMLIPLYSLFSFLSLCFPEAKVYLLPWLDVFQANSLCAFFLLMCDYISTSHEQRDVFFAAFTVLDKKSPNGSINGLAWYRKRWIMIFQYPVVALLTAIATDITQAAGVFCQYESKTYFAKLWISIVQFISVGAAFTSVLMFIIQLKPHLAEHKPMAKLVAFKLIVALNFLQSIIFLILTDTSALNPTAKLTYADLNIGIPAMLSCIEMVPISLFLVFAYSVKPYLINRSNTHAMEAGSHATLPRSYQGGFLGIRAFLSMFNPMETLEAIAFAFKMATESQRSGSGTRGYSQARYESYGSDSQDEHYPMTRR